MPRRTEADPQTAKLGARLRQLRNERNMSLGDLADACDVSKGHLSSIEHGLASITVPTISRLADGLAVRALFLLVSPEDDDRDQIAEFVRQLPAHEVVKLRKNLQKTVKEAAKAAEKAAAKANRGRA